MHVLRSVSGLIVIGGVIAALGCSTGPRQESFDGTWQMSGPSTDQLEVVESGENIAGKIMSDGDSVGTVSGTNRNGQLSLNLILGQFFTPDGVIGDYRFSITGHFVNANSVVGTESDSPGSTVTLTRH
jgi:hypothetical protein